MTAPRHDLTLTHESVSGLRTYHRNPRQGDVATIRQSLKVNGQYRALVVNRGTHTGRPGEVLAGNHTLMAARDEGWATVAVTWVDVDDDQAARIVAVDNRASDNAVYDDRILLELLADLPDLDGTGYDPGDIAALEAALADDTTELPPALNDPDDVPESGRQPFCELGDVWQLGPHRLAVGDSTDVTVWDNLLQGDHADMVWTDPPYGVSYVGKTKAALTIENDTLSEDGLADFLHSVFDAVITNTRPGAVWYVASPPGPLHLVFGAALHDLGVLRQSLVWAKDQFVMGRSDYHYRHELIYYGWTPGAAHHPVPDRKQDSLHEVDRPKANKEHPTMKPVALMARHIENSTNPDDLVVDPFGGSGSTLMACHTVGRRAALIELDRKYADVICRRYQEHTGTTPTRDGVPHDFTAGT